MMKKLSAVALAAAMSFSLSACTLGSTSWILKYGDDNQEVPTGIYVQNMYTAYSAAGQYATGGDTLLESSIEDKTADQWIRDTAMNLTKQYLAVTLKFDELGLTLTEAENTNIQSMVDSVWKSYGESYTLMGVNRDSYQKMLEYTAKTGDLFQHFYGEGGELAPTEEEYKQYFNDNYDRTRAVSYAKTSVDTMTEDELAAAEAELEEGETLPESGKAQAEAALARLQNGEDMITIIKEMEAEQEQDSEEETADGEETAEEETDPSEYDNVVSVSNTSVPEVYRTESHAMAVGEVKIIESDNYYYVVEKLELDPDGSELTARKSSLLQEMKSDEFDAMVQEWIAALPELTVNRTKSPSVPDQGNGRAFFALRRRCFPPEIFRKGENAVPEYAGNDKTPTSVPAEQEWGFYQRSQSASHSTP